MLETERFGALGVYNGFPFCLDKRDVGNAFLYAPLTLEEASALYYNLAEAKGTATLTTSGLSLAVADTGLLTLPPRKRACGFPDVGASKVDFGNQIYYRVSIEFKLPTFFFKMYDGPTGNEGNFIGYGFEGELAVAAANEDGGSGRVGTNDILANYCLYDPATLDANEQLWFRQYSILGTNDLTVSEKTVSGIPFILFRYDNPIGVTTQTAEITALEFYTFPE